MPEGAVNVALAVALPMSNRPPKTLTLSLCGLPSQLVDSTKVDPVAPSPLLDSAAVWVTVTSALPSPPEHVNVSSTSTKIPTS
jgi:hypothetical protein